MPARLTPKGLLVVDWDFQAKRWQAGMRLPRVRDLYRVADVQPDVTISQLFDLVDQDSDLKHFLGELCWCNADAVHRRPRAPVEEIVVYPSHLAMKASEGAMPAEFLILEKGITFGSHRVDEPPERFELRYRVWAGRNDFKHRELVAAPTIGHAWSDFQLFLDACFGTAVNLPLRLGTMLSIEDRPDWQVETTFTLLEILSSIYYSLGDAPELMNANQPRIEGEELLRELFPEYFGDGE